MQMPCLVVFALIIHATLVCVITTEQGEQFLNKYGHIVGELCRGISVCGSDIIPVAIGIDAGEVGCCNPCTCDEDTGQTNVTQCFPTANTTSNTSHLEMCLIPLQGLESVGRMVSDMTSYSMVVLQPSQSDMSSENQQNISESTTDEGHEGHESCDCIDDTLIGFNNMLPVTSLSTNKIYINAKCATCHGDSNVIPWLLSMKCASLDNDDVQEQVMTLLSGSMPTWCNVLFINPQEDLNPNTCASPAGLVTDCPHGTDFYIRSSWNISHEAVVDACINGPTSVVIGTEGLRPLLYKNIFCKICHGEILLIYCSPNLMAGGIPAFTALLTMSAPKKGRGEAQKTVPVACDHPQSDQDDETCRPILCPFYQLRNKDGNCYYPLQWFDTRGKAYKLAIKLTPLENIDVGLFENYMTLDQYTLTPPTTADQWLFDYVAYQTEPTEDNTGIIIKQFIVVMYTYHTKPEAIVFLRNAKLYVDGVWLLEFGNRSLRLQADFYEHTRGNRPLADDYIDKPHRCSTQLAEFFMPQTVIYTADDSELYYSPITSLHFCDRVTLREDEYVVVRAYRGDSVAIVYNTGSVLFKWNNMLGTVCLRQSGLHRQTSTAPSTMWPICTAIHAMLVTGSCFYAFSWGLV